MATKNMPGYTTMPGYENPKHQFVVRKTDLHGTDHNQYVYVMRCLLCHQGYGANGTDIARRRCPFCQRGAPGIPFAPNSISAAASRLNRVADSADEKEPSAVPESSDCRTFILHLPEAVQDLWKAQQTLARRYASTGLKFTLDGRLVGDIAEALALERFGLHLPSCRTGGVDAVTARGKTVQIKATGLLTTGPAFTPGKGFAEKLLFFRINFAENHAEVAYNGPEAPIRSLLPKQWTGTRQVTLVDIQRLNSKVKAKDRLRLCGAAGIDRHGTRSSM